MAANLTGTEAGGAILALVVLFLAGFLARAHHRRTGSAPAPRPRSSGPIDRLLGLGFGAAKGVLAAALIFLMTNLVFDTIDPGEPSPDWLAKARTAPTLAMISKTLVDFVGEHARIAPDSAALDAARRAGTAQNDSAGMPRDRNHGDRRRTAMRRGSARRSTSCSTARKKPEPSTPI